MTFRSLDGRVALHRASEPAERPSKADDAWRSSNPALRTALLRSRLAAFRRAPRPIEDPLHGRLGTSQ